MRPQEHTYAHYYTKGLMNTDYLKTKAVDNMTGSQGFHMENVNGMIVGCNVSLKSNGGYTFWFEMNGERCNRKLVEQFMSTAA